LTVTLKQEVRAAQAMTAVPSNNRRVLEETRLSRRQPLFRADPQRVQSPRNWN